MSFFETCKILVNTETAYKHNTPHLIATGIGHYTQGLAGAVEFDYKDVYDREDEYNDVVGFYHTHPSGLNQMSPTDIDTMIQWVKCFGKSLVCLIETEQQTNGWIFIKGKDGEVTHSIAEVQSGNDVNYDIWLERQSPFWSPADFLIDGDIYDEPEFDEVDVQESLVEIHSRIDALTKAMETLVNAMTKENEDDED